MRVVIQLMLLYYATVFSNVEHGSHNIVLLENGASYNLPCIPLADKPNEEELRTHRVFKSTWFNVTANLFDPTKTLPKSDVDKVGFGEPLQYNEFLTHATTGQLLLRNVTPALTGFYECIASFADSFREIHEENMRTRHIRHLIEVTSAPIWVVTIRVPFYTEISTPELLQNVITKAKHIASSSSITNDVTVPESEAHCSESQTEIIECEATLQLRPPAPKLVSTCSKYCMVYSMVKSLRKDVGVIRSILNVMENQEKWQFGEDVVRVNSSNVKVIGYRDCPLGYWRDNQYCRPCHPGKYRDYITTLCLPCPRYHYQPSFGQSSCIACPPGTSTLADIEGASSINSCQSQGFMANFKEETRNIFKNLFNSFK